MRLIKSRGWERSSCNVRFTYSCSCSYITAPIRKTERIHKQRNPYLDMQCSRVQLNSRPLPLHCLIGMTSARQMSGTCQIAEPCVLYLSSLLVRPDRSQPSFTALSQRQDAPRHHKILERVRIFESGTHQISSPSLSKGGFCLHLRVS
jgi:hypothetical protein